MKINPSAARSPAISAQAGFSLIEIIVVITMIAIIAGFVLSKVSGGRDRANVRLAQTQVQTLAGDVQAYEQDTGVLPDSLEGLVNAPSGVSGWLGPYAKKAALKDPWNHPFAYKAPGEGQPFDLYSLGKDGQAGGDSVNADIKYE